MAEKIDPSKMKVSELKAELTARGADSSGLKNDLIQRLQQILDDEEEFGDIPGSEEPLVAASEKEEDAPVEVKAETETESPKEEEEGGDGAASGGEQEKKAKKPKQEPKPIELDDATKARLEKAAARAARFGIEDKASEVIMKQAREEAKRAKNAARMALLKEKKAAKKAEKRKAREEMEAVAAAENDKKKARAERFGGKSDADAVPVGADADAETA